MSTFLLIRHAQSELHGRFCGGLDPALSSTGEAEARELASKLATAAIGRIYCSPLQRALATAGTIAEATGSSLQVIDSLREIDFGSWEGLTWNEIELRDPEYASLWMEQHPLLPAPGGESFDAFRRRVEAAFRQIWSEGKPCCGKTLAVVAHAGALAVVMSIVSGKPLRSVPCLACARSLEIQIGPEVARERFAPEQASNP